MKNKKENGIRETLSILVTASVTANRNHFLPFHYDLYQLPDVFRFLFFFSTWKYRESSALRCDSFGHLSAKTQERDRFGKQTNSYNFHEQTVVCTTYLVAVEMGNRSRAIDSNCKLDVRKVFKLVSLCIRRRRARHFYSRYIRGTRAIVQYDSKFNSLSGWHTFGWTITVLNWQQLSVTMKEKESERKHVYVIEGKRTNFISSNRIESFLALLPRHVRWMDKGRRKYVHRLMIAFEQ